jgi:hypothetical protein
MKSMNDVREFMLSYFKERSVIVREEMERRKPLRAAYFTDRCTWDSRRDCISRSEGEAVVDISVADDMAAVITSGGFGIGGQKLLYDLRFQSGRWLIENVQFECPCTIGGRSVRERCVSCHGTGWVGGDGRDRQSSQSGSDTGRRN